MASSSNDFPTDKPNAGADDASRQDRRTASLPSSGREDPQQGSEAEGSASKVTSLKSQRIGHTLDLRTLSSEDVQVLRTLTAEQRSLLGQAPPGGRRLVETVDQQQKPKEAAPEARVVETVDLEEEDKPGRKPPAAPAQLQETLEIEGKEAAAEDAAQVADTLDLADGQKPPGVAARLLETAEFADKEQPPAAPGQVADTLDLVEGEKPPGADSRLMETAEFAERGKPPAPGDQLAQTLDGPDVAAGQILETAQLEDGAGPPAADPRLPATLDKPTDQSSIRATIGRGSVSETADLDREVPGARKAARTWSQLVIQPRQLIAGEEVGAIEGADYEVDRLLGKGAMGVVFAARQTSISRSVAVKMLKAKRADDKKQRDQFLAEAVVTGDLDHPNIVPIYDLAKTQDGALFYSMKHVKGTPWDKAIGERTLAENLAVWLDVGDAMAFAHDRGVVHRDLKPENIMLGDYGEVLVMDWGMAVSQEMLKDPRIRDSSGLGGTPAYMAPEMAIEAPLHRIKPAADIYLMGAILFEIVTGTPPHRGKDVLSCVLAAARNEIVPTDQKGELLDIAMKAMANRPENRYASIKELQAAVREFLAHTESNKMVSRAEESQARARETLDYNDFQQSIAAYREALTIWADNREAQAGLETVSMACAQRTLQTGDLDLGLSVLDPDKPDHQPLIRKLQFKRRLRQGVRVLIFTLAALIVIALIVAVVQWREANKAQELANQKADDARKSATEAMKQQKIATQRATEAQEAQALAQENADRATRQADKAQAASYRARIALAASQIDANAFNQANRELQGIRTQWQDSELMNPPPWEFTRLSFMLGLSEHTLLTGFPVQCVAFGPQGKYFAAGGQTAPGDDQAEVKLWELRSGQPVDHATLRTKGTQVSALAFVERDGQTQLITVSNDQKIEGLQSRFPTYLSIWDVTTGNSVQSLEVEASDPKQQRWMVSMDVCDDPKTLRLLTTWKAMGTSGGLARLENAVQLQAEASTDGVLRLALEGGNLAVHGEEASDAAISKDGNVIVASDMKGNVMVWRKDTAGAFRDVRDHREGEQGFVPHTNKEVYAVEFSPDDTRFATAGGDGRVLIWRKDQVAGGGDAEDADLTTNAELVPCQTLRAGAQPIRCVNYDPGGTHLVAGGEDGVVRLWDLSRASEEPMWQFRGHSNAVLSCVFNPKDPDMVLSGSLDGEVRIWSVSRYREFLALQLTQWQEVLDAAFSPDGSRVVAAQGTLANGAATVWNLSAGGPKLGLAQQGPKTLQEGHTMPITHAVPILQGPSPRLLTMGLDQTVRIWDLITGRQISRLAGTTAYPNYDSPLVAASADGNWILAAASAARSAEPNAANEMVAARLWRRSDFEESVDCPPFQELKGHVRLLKTRDSDRPSSNFITAVAVSKTGRFLFTGDRVGRGLLWRRKPDGSSYELLQPLPSMSLAVSQISAACFTPDESRLLCAVGYRVYQFEIPTAQPRAEGHLDHTRNFNVKSIDLSLDGTRLATSCDDGSVWLWNIGGQAAKPERLARWQPGEHASGQGAPTEPSAHGATARQVGKVSISANGDQVLVVMRERPIGPQIGRAGQAQATNRVVLLTWDARQRTLQQRILPLSTGTQEIRSVAFTNQAGTEIATVLGGMAGVEAVLWDVSANPASQRQRLAPCGLTLSARFSSGRGKRLVTAHRDDDARVWNVETGRLQYRLRDPQQTKDTETAVCALFAHDDKFVLAGTSDGTVEVWEAAEDATNARWRKELCRQPGNACAIHALALEPHERFLVTASEDGTARVWPLKSGNPNDIAIDESRPPQTLAGHAKRVLCVDVSADGKWIVTGSEDEKAIIWDAASGKKLQEFGSGNGAIRAVHFGGRDRRVVIGCFDGTAHIYAIRKVTQATEPAENPDQTAAAGEGPPPAASEDIAAAEASGQQIASIEVDQVLTLREHGQEVTAAAFSPDGRNVLTASRDGRTILWPSKTVQQEDGQVASASAPDENQTKRGQD